LCFDDTIYFFIVHEKSKTSAAPLRDNAQQHATTLKLRSAKQNYHMKKSRVNQVENFEKLIVFCNTQSAVYKPSKASIQLDALSTLLTQAQQSLRAADGARTAYENAINGRQSLFVGLPKLASRMIDALKASGVSAEVVTDANSIKNRLYGASRRLVPTTASNAGATVPASYQYGVSHRDLASKIENFERLVNRVTVEVLYKPNENDLKPASLATLVQQLRTANRAVMNAYMAMKNANRQLGVLLYASGGVYENARMVKAYLSSVFGKGSGQHKEVTLLKFTNK
jgi:hypothetical protein